jgi:hypothetical protein
MLLCRWPCNGSTQRLGRLAAPVSAPVTEPTVAPFESVSQPPLTTAQIDRSRSPRPYARAAATSAALFWTCTQCR